MATFLFTNGQDSFIGAAAASDVFTVNDLADVDFILVENEDRVTADPDDPGTFDTLQFNVADLNIILGGSFAGILGIEQISFGVVTPHIVTFPNNNFINLNADDTGTLTVDGSNLPSITVDGQLITVANRQLAVVLTRGDDSVFGTAGDDFFDQVANALDSLPGGADTTIGGDGDDALRIDIADLDGVDSFNGGNGSDAVVIEGSWTLTTGVGPLQGLVSVEEIGFGDLTDGLRNLIATDAYVGTISGTLMLSIFDQQIQPVSIDGSALTGANRLQVLTNQGNSPDSLVGGEGNDVLDGGAGNDTLIGGAGNDTLIGGDDDDSLTPGPGNYVVNGNGGDDVVDLTGAGTGVIFSGAGNDTMVGTPDELSRSLTLDGGDDTDTVQLVSAGVLNLASLTTLADVEQLFGSSGDDAFIATTQQLQGFDAISGGLGNDTLSTSDALLDTLGLDLDQIEFLSTANTSGTTFRLLQATLDFVLSGVIGNVGFDSIEVADGIYNDTTSGGGYDGTTGIEQLVFGNDSITATQSLTLTDDFVGRNGVVSGGTHALSIDPGPAVAVIVDGSGLTVSTNSLSIGNSLGDDTLIGGAGADAIDLSSGTPSSGADSIAGGAGNDSLFLDDGADLDSDDRIDGGAGTDRLIITSGSFVDLRTPSAFTSIEQAVVHDQGLTLILPANAAMTVTGGAGADVIAGRAGNESISGGNGNDALFGGNGADTLIGGDGADTLVGDNQGGFPGGQPAADLLDGGIGADALFGEDGADTLIGGAGADTVVGGTGNDNLSGGDDDDFLFGDQGADQVAGNDGNDVLVGFMSSTGDPFGTAQTDSDTLNGGGGADTVFGGGGADVITGDDGDDALLGFGGNDNIDGGTGNDQIVAYADISGTDADTLIGGGGNDSLFAGGGADSLLGGDGSDFLLADDGADTLDGGGGDDFLLGDTGADRFRFAPGGGSDLILDFVRGEDLLDLAAFGPITIGGNVTLALFENAVRLQFNSGDALSIVGITDLQPGDIMS